MDSYLTLVHSNIFFSVNTVSAHTHTNYIEKVLSNAALTDSAFGGIPLKIVTPGR